MTNVVKPQHPPFINPPVKPVPTVPKVVTPPTVPEFSEAALVAAVAALPGATLLTVSEDLFHEAKMVVSPGIHGAHVAVPPPASIANLRVRSGGPNMSPKTWGVSVS